MKTTECYSKNNYELKFVFARKNLYLPPSHKL